jgi:hypothetical protein
MKLISHRGNLKGPIPNKENRPSYIDCAIKLGYEVEVDIRFINGEFYLGHDTPDYKISPTWIAMRSESLWFHCKDIESAHELKKLNKNIKFFCHSNDPYIITSTGNLWVHDLNMTLNNNCIIPLLSKKEINSNNINYVYAICSDYIIQ